jgi:hypothetical protein
MITPRILQRLAAVLVLACGLMLMTLASPASAQMGSKGDNEQPPLISAVSLAPPSTVEQPFTVVAATLEPYCPFLRGGCECSLDRIVTPCWLVLFCVDAKLCEFVPQFP